MDYKQQVYNSYRSAFKGDTDMGRRDFVSQKMIDVLKPWIRDIDKLAPVADLGCGAGELLLGLRKFGFEKLSGCDLSEEQVIIARKEFPNVANTDLFNFLHSHEDFHFQLIIVFDVLEHLTKQEVFDLLKLIHQKLKFGGMLIAHTPNGISPFVGHVFWGDVTHEWCMTPSTASVICNIHGYKNFAAKEHLGAGNGIYGGIRIILWACVRLWYQFLNLIETGDKGGNIWTRNFVFKAEK